ncbi:hypothetical protein NADFUDRAFT_43100 [Nadsonia fulvescens var. elongata DSM 6958]|uniref:DNA endonuclease activator Ctp1 C-terminal domain-containing protein n=1 Tax=Nadsonia fulvescens var. elongata DSM 6958 TaxID=857566 RepID=A0A1E3PHV8_9ASCO|nr:hypothetical protein NADFUDRAFT_43100 [Nadsonia fulvescens var. elongata DSM 6958]
MDGRNSNTSTVKIKDEPINENGKEDSLQIEAPLLADNAMTDRVNEPVLNSNTSISNTNADEKKGYKLKQLLDLVVSPNLQYDESLKDHLQILQTGITEMSDMIQERQQHHLRTRFIAQAIRDKYSQQGASHAKLLESFESQKALIKNLNKQIEDLSCENNRLQGQNEKLNAFHQTIKQQRVSDATKIRKWTNVVTVLKQENCRLKALHSDLQLRRERTQPEHTFQLPQRYISIGQSNNSEEINLISEASTMDESSDGLVPCPSNRNKEWEQATEYSPRKSNVCTLKMSRAHGIAAEEDVTEDKEGGIDIETKDPNQLMALVRSSPPPSSDNTMGTPLSLKRRKVNTDDSDISGDNENNELARPKTATPLQLASQSSLNLMPTPDTETRVNQANPEWLWSLPTATDHCSTLVTNLENVVDATPTRLSQSQFVKDDFDTGGSSVDESNGDIDIVWELDDFVPNPLLNDNLSFAFKETGWERRTHRCEHQMKSRTIGGECQECIMEVTTASSTTAAAATITEPRISKTTKAVAVWEPHSSPPGYWDVEFPSTQKIHDNNKRAELKRQREIELRLKSALMGGKWIFRDPNKRPN